MQNKILNTVLACFVLCMSFTLFGCSGNGNTTETKVLESKIETSALEENSKVDDVETVPDETVGTEESSSEDALDSAIKQLEELNDLLDE